MPVGWRERWSERLLAAGIERGAEREQMQRTIRAVTRDEEAYRTVAGQLLLAEGVDTFLRWLAVRLRPRPGGPGPRP